MEFKAVLFDLDGTLLDTLEDLGNTVNQILVKAGLPPHPIDAYRHFVGEGAAQLMRRVLPENLQDEQIIGEYLTAFNAQYEQNWNVCTQPYEGVGAMLDGLHSKGISLSILSNKPDEFTQKCVNEFLGKWKFDQVLGYRKPFLHKPDPGGALEIAKTLQINPEEFLYLGDTATDMLTANAAQMFAVGVLWGFRPMKELQDGGAQALIKKPQEVLHFWD